jgi:cytochrome c551/c552
LEKSAGKFAAEANRSNAIERSVTRGVGSASGEIPRAPEPAMPEENDEQRLQRLLGE